MLNMSLFVSIIGFSAVLQGGLNRILLKKWGLFEVTLLNNFIVFLYSVFLYFIVKTFGERLPEDLQHKGNLLSFEWVLLLSGLMGFLIVNGIPYAFSKYGALKVFLVLVCSQIIGSMLWDIVVEKIAVTPMRLASAGVAILSVVLTALDKQK